MANNFWEALQQTAGDPIPVGGYTNQLQQLIQAKTGKAPVATTGPRRTNLLEQQAAAMGRAETTQLLGEAQLAQAGQQQQMNIQQQQAQQQAQQMEQGVQEKKAALRAKADELYANVKTSYAEMDTSRKVAAFEQLGFMYSLSNDKYIDRLNTEATKRRLENKIQEELALKAAVFSEQLDLLKSNLQFKRMIDLQEDRMLQALNAMDIEMAIQIAAADTAAEARKANYKVMSEASGKLIEGASPLLAPKESAQEDEGPSIFDFGKGYNIGTLGN
jgi:hypothetical protein